MSRRCHRDYSLRCGTLQELVAKLLCSQIAKHIHAHIKGLGENYYIIALAVAN